MCIDAWLDLRLSSGESLLINPNDEELIEKSVRAFRKRYASELLQVITSDEILDLRRIEGGFVHIPVSLVMYWSVCIPEEEQRYSKICSYIDGLSISEGEYQ